MNNQTMSISPTGFVFSIGHLASIFSLLFILILILIILFFLFITQKDKNFFNESESQDDMGTSYNERRSFQHGQFKQYSSMMNNQQYPSISSFQMDIDEQNTRSTVNLLSSK